MRLDDCDESVFGTYHRVRRNDLVQSAEGLRTPLLLSNFQSSNLIDPKDVHFSAFFEYDCNVRSWNWQENLFRFLDINPRTSRCLDCKRTKRNLGCSVLNLLNFHFCLSNSILMLLKF